MSNSDRRAKLEAFLSEFEMDGVVIIHKSVVKRSEPIEAIPTGLCSFDFITGIGGLPRGRVVTFSGKEAAGKTMLALLAIGRVQKTGGQAAYIDAEHALTPSFAKLLGASYDDMTVVKPDTMEAGFDALKRFIQADIFDIICYDSLAGLAPKELLEADAGESNSRAALARFLSQEMPKITAVIDASTNTIKPVVIFINQLREKPDAGPMVRDSTYNPGGRAVRHAASMVVDIKIREPHYEAKKRVGHRAAIKITKNKLAPPFAECEFNLYYKGGIDKLTDLIDTAIAAGIVRRESSFFIFEGHKWHGREAAESALRADGKLAKKAYDLVMKQLSESASG